MARKKRNGDQALARAPQPAKRDEQARRQKMVANPKVEYSKALNFYLRKDFGDIGLFSKPDDTSDAEGSDFSWTRDRRTSDTTWAADGIVAASYSVVPEYLLSTNFRGLAAAVYAGATKETHSKNVDDNVDVKKFGVSGEVGWYQPVLAGSHYFRGAVAFKQDDIKDASLTHGQIEYLPVWLWDRMHGNLPFGSATLIFNVRPELSAQYDSNTDSTKTILFSNQKQAFRIGPQVAFWSKLSAPNSSMAGLFEQTFFTLTYHWWDETYSGKTKSWLDAAIVHNLDSSGYIALKFSYRKGQNEDTGANTDLIKVSLSAKTCADLISGKSC